MPDTSINIIVMDRNPEGDMFNGVQYSTAENKTAALRKRRAHRQRNMETRKRVRDSSNIRAARAPALLIVPDQA